MNRKIYREIAKKHGISVGEVKREMQAAINTAYENPNSQALSISRKNDVPTINEFINHTIEQIKNDK